MLYIPENAVTSEEKRQQKPSAVNIANIVQVNAAVPFNAFLGMNVSYRNTRRKTTNRPISCFIAKN